MMTGYGEATIDRTIAGLRSGSVTHLALPLDDGDVLQTQRHVFQREGQREALGRQHAQQLLHAAGVAPLGAAARVAGT